MKVYEVTCAGCGQTFEAKSPRARWHDPACRKRSQRAAAATAPKPRAAKPKTSTRKPRTPAVDRHGLVVSVKAELTKAGVLDTFDGQLALQLARRLATPDESGISSLSKELRAVMLTALAARVDQQTDASDKAEAETDDGDGDSAVLALLGPARAKRDAARQKAGGA